MKRIITFILCGLFIVSIVIFAGFGERIRDYYSPHVDVMPINERLFSNGMFAQVLLSSCFFEEEDGKVYAYIVKENSESGERAYYAKKVEVEIGDEYEKYTEIRKIADYTNMYISSSDRELSEGKRVVIERIVN